MTSEAIRLSEEDAQLVVDFEGFLRKVYYEKLMAASNNGEPLIVDFKDLDEFKSNLSDLLLEEPKKFFDIVDRAMSQVEIPKKIPVRIFNLPSPVAIRDLRAKHVNKFLCVEGIVRKASEIRPEVMECTWECPECGAEILQERRGNFISFPAFCDCGNRKGFKEKNKKMIDTRWIVIEEPFELTEGERPSQVTILLKEDLVSPEGRRKTDPGNRLKITGVLTDIPKVAMAGKGGNVKLDFYLDSNHVDPTEVGWERLKITKEEEEEIKKEAADPGIYKKLVDSLAPSLYGLEEIKESVVLQLFGGVQRFTKDGSKVRGNIHILLVGDPSSGKSQLLKLVPQIVPRGKYVSGKGTTTAGLTATVSKDEQFMGGWVLEAGAMVLAHKGLLAVDEFEKMEQGDQVAMHEALEQGSVSIAKASIIATLPAETSVLAGGNPKFSRFDPYLPIAKQITIPDTLLTRFDLKFILKDIPDEGYDKKVTEHLLRSRDDDYEEARPKMNTTFIRKYISYTKEHCKPLLTKEAGKLLRKFYVDQRKRAEGGGPIPITLRQFEALIRLSEASAKIQLSDIVRKEDADRAIKLMTFSLRQLGMDPDTGKIDIDRSDGSTPASERSHIRIVLDIVGEMSEKKKEIPIAELTEKAKKQGVANVEEIIEKLRREGLLFEPNPGYVQKV
ncbi:MAG: minichromosome maintenance protein MCM [Candidatus Aenigmarchaeota archaeon]|nr:minichromosome maintenance protein MCM [Candidatus Aenigmarchaeota archaeon]